MAGMTQETWTVLHDAAKRFVDKVSGDGLRHTDADGFDRETWRGMAELGWFGLAVPEALGGLGESVGALAPVAEAVGAGNIAEPVMAVAGVATPLLSEAAEHDPASAAFLERVLAGDTVATLAHFEPESGFARSAVATRAASDGGNWVLNGTKTAVEGGPATGLFLVSAQAAGRIALFAVAADSPGVALRTYRSLDGRLLVELHLSEARLDAASCIMADAAEAIDAALDRGAFLAMADAVGAMQVLFDDTLAHLRTRKQFGQPLSAFQALQHRAVDMFIALEEARGVVEAAAMAMDCEPLERMRAVATAKVIGARSARLISREAVQMHGGIGITEDLRISHYFRRLVVAENLYGDEDHYLDRFRDLTRADAEPAAGNGEHQGGRIRTCKDTKATRP
jgi:alkylation response protein AidB-like acyl-CoA dehydrogenase